MLQISRPEDTLARTRMRLSRRGPTRGVILANVFDWVSLSLQQSLLYILLLTLGLALLGRAGLTAAQLALLVPLCWLLVVRPARHAASTTRHQLRQHRIGTSVWRRDAAPDGDEADER